MPNPRALAPLADELRPSYPGQIALASVLVLCLLVVTGLGWSLWAFGTTLEGVAAAPALGVAMLALIGLIFERIGVPITGWMGPTATSLVTAGAGFALLIRGRRTPSAASDRTSA